MRGESSEINLNLNEDLIFVEFMGAARVLSDDDDELWAYKPRGPISLTLDKIIGFYDNTVITDGHKIRVMENYEQIKEAINNAAGEKQ